MLFSLSLLLHPVYYQSISLPSSHGSWYVNDFVCHDSSGVLSGAGGKAQGGPPGSSQGVPRHILIILYSQFKALPKKAPFPPPSPLRPSDRSASPVKGDKGIRIGHILDTPLHLSMLKTVALKFFCYSSFLFDRDAGIALNLSPIAKSSQLPYSLPSQGLQTLSTKCSFLRRPVLLN